MDISVQRLLSDKLYDKRKAGALELENTIRTCLNEHNHDRIAKIVHQLCHDYAYAVHQPHARNGGLIGLAAAAIALGSEVARYLKEIVPPVLACFSDQDARVRYYACESTYNIAKVAKGETLIYFNDVFDALCRLSADTELSVKNGAELLDRLVKDIVSESAASYASILVPEEVEVEVEEVDDGRGRGEQQTKAFSLPKFIPLLQERIFVLNPFTRTFLVSWITLLDSIPDLELVAYLPSFLAGLLKFLSDPNQDVHTTTKVALDRFLTEIKQIAAVKRGIHERRRSREVGRKASVESRSSGVIIDSPGSDKEPGQDDDDATPTTEIPATANGEASPAETKDDTTLSPTPTPSHPDDDDEKAVIDGEDEWLPGQDVTIAYQEILDILVTFLAESNEEEIQLTTLKWIETFLDICPEDILAFTPRLLAQVLPALSHDVDLVKQAARRVNERVMGYIMGLPEDSIPAKAEGDGEEEGQQRASPLPQSLQPGIPSIRALREANGVPSRTSTARTKPMSPEPVEPPRTPEPTPTITTTTDASPSTTSSPKQPQTSTDLDYEAAVQALTAQFLHAHESTRVAALAWLIMLHRKSPRRILAIQDATFPALLQTLSDPAEAVVTRDLLLLSQISKTSDDSSYFTSFMVNLLRLFKEDRNLLEHRGNLIIRQLCLSLSAEKIYRTMADCLEHEIDDGDVEFAATMVQNLNNNLLTAPELADLRKRLRNLSSTPNDTFFTVLFRAWCVNAVATFSLCLLAQAYEQAYNLLQIFADLEMTVNMLIQIDKLVQLLESPVFTYLRMQLVEPERYPFLYKCLYGVLMLLPQSSAFAALKNRLGSVSAIGYLQITSGAARAGTGQGVGVGGVASTFERQNRLKNSSSSSGSQSREDGGIKWAELLERFRLTQERVRRSQQRSLGLVEEEAPLPERKVASVGGVGVGVRRQERPGSAQSFGRAATSMGLPTSTAQSNVATPGHAKTKSGLSQLGKFARGQKGKK